jgi:hypothetical protein
MDQPKFWQQELFRERTRLQEVIDREGLPYLAGPSVLLEKFVFVTAYIARKLIEADVLTVEMLESHWPVKRFRAIAEPPHRAWFRISEDGSNWRQPIEQYYDLAHSTDERMGFEDLSNRLIHHFAFVLRLAADEQDIEILFNSEQTNDRLWLITLSSYRQMVEEVAYDEATWQDSSRYERRMILRRRRPEPGKW